MIETVKRLLSGRRQAYSRAFDTANSSDAQVIVADLMRFCRFGESVFHPNQRVTDVLIGRQEVLTRILDHAGLDLETLYLKYHTDKAHQRKGTDE